MRKILTVTAVAAVLASASAGYAAPNPATTTFQVQAQVLKACTVSATTLNFNQYTPGGGPLAATSTINVFCTKTTPYTVALDGGTTTGGTVAQRLMANGTNTLQYNLYTTVGHTTVFGDGTGTSVTQSSAGLGFNVANPMTVFGQLLDNAANQGAVPGNYADTIGVTVTY
jgi:spore coat protein U-like protein